MSRNTIRHVYAILRADPEFEGLENQITVKEIVESEPEARAEVDRLNLIRRGESFYFWQITRLTCSGVKRGL